MIRSLLIANRGEIACRVIRTARALGVRTVAVYSDADAHALHVRQADEAVHIGPSPAAESYLRGDRIIEAALATGAEAIHPGYGFLSENADFAQEVIDAGLVWVGPSPASIRAMGLKDAAKKLMIEAGVPVTPGYLGEDQSPERLQREAEAIGYPVLIKAVAGGGGKGMRKVDAPEDFLAALESCKREAQASFGNDAVLLEKWIASPRHIEVQVFGDSHGNVVHLFERDCSLQRRHQKVIEEAPAPGMDPDTREAICAAAVRAAKAVDYVNAGTIEFIADASAKDGGGLSADRVFFMEMNTRLQVEHPVTEEITGVDLVEWQLRVASGEPLPLKQEQLSIDGHAIEARLYAEDPAKGFLPSTGRFEHLHFDDEIARLETGIDVNSEISPFYDPMIGKIICHATTRDQAIDELIGAVEQTDVWPVRTNASFVARALDTVGFRSGQVDTGLIGRQGDALLPPEEPASCLWQVAARLCEPRGELGIDGFRLNAQPRFGVVLGRRGKFRLVNLEESWCNVRSFEWDGGRGFTCEGETGEVLLARGYVVDERVIVFVGGTAYEFDRSARGSGAAGVADGAILAPMPGKVIAVDVAEGQTVEAGQRLMVLEAMKMEHALTAPFAGTLAELSAREGQQVEVDALLARVEKGVV